MLFDLEPPAPAFTEPALFPADQAAAYLIGRPRPTAPTVEYPTQQLTFPGLPTNGAQGALILA